MKIETGNVQQVRGVQKSMWDEYEVHFKNPGDFVRCPAKSDDEPEGLTSASASQFAKRMMKLTGHPFHSYFHAIEKKFYVRRRLEGEVPVKGDDAEESSDDSELELN